MNVLDNNIVNKWGKVGGLTTIQRIKNAIVSDSAIQLIVCQNGIHEELY